MLDSAINIDNLISQANKLKRKRFKPGFDGMTAQSAVKWLEINGDQLRRRILRGSYDPMPAKGFLSAKRNGGYRQLVKLSALDMVIQNAVLSVLAPYCENLFSDFTYAYRPNRGVSAAVGQYCACGSAYPYAAMVDPSACFDNIDHTVLEKTLAEHLGDQELVSLIMKYVRMPVVIENEAIIPTKGILQGAPLSNLLCNLYFSSLDKYLEANEIPFVRYADDIVLFSADREQMTQNYTSVMGFLKENLFLNESRRKCRIDSPDNLTFLGYRFEKSRYGLSAVEDADPDAAIHRQWYESEPADHHRCVDIVSDGILRQKDFSAVFESEECETSLPIVSTDTINVYSSVTLDSGFLQKAMCHNVTINLFDQNDRLVGRFIPNHPMHSPHVPHRQLLTYYDEAARLALARQFVLASIHNCRLNIRYYNKQHPSDVYEKALSGIKEIERDIKGCKAYESLLMLEAKVREHYYGCFDSFLSGTDFHFDTRTRRPPQNEVNAMLGFGNVLLYNLIASEINKTPLDVRIGFLHATNRRPESLNLDVAESYKPLIVDRTVFALVNLKTIRLTDFDHRPDGGVYLNANGKRSFLRAFYDKLDTMITVKGRKLTYRQIIAEDVRALVRHFRQDDAYTPFKQVK